MRKIHLLGIFLILADFALFLICAFFEIGVGAEEPTIIDQSYGPNFGITVGLVGGYIEWYIWLPLILIVLLPKGRDSTPAPWAAAGQWNVTTAPMAAITPSTPTMRDAATPLA